MTIDEAIKHAREVAAQGCTECNKQHAQLAEWLEELIRRKRELEVLIWRLTDVETENKAIRKDLVNYKKALELACDEIMWRECRNVYNYNYYCKTDCETYDACTKKIKWEDYFLDKAKEGKD